MGNREFEKAVQLYASQHVTGSGSMGLIRKIASHFYDVRQPEIDALKHKLAVTDDGFRAAEHLIANYRSEIDALKTKVASGVASIKGYAAENAALKAEVERLRKDAEKSRATCKMIGEVMHDNLTAMQAAFIEWRFGDGAEAGMGWIVNTLAGPGLLPDANSPYGTEAQAWFDANKSRPFPVCFCGRPSNSVWMGKGFCSEKHYEQHREQLADAAMKETK